ncbi:MAG: hypothetical protein FJ298_06310 [Planctomycetes bacterium]|nr:hypothetical protein [Planctomycetota bacterium]
MSANQGGLGALLAVRREERAQVALAVGAFFCVLFSIFLLRPLRDAAALVGGAENLVYLWAVTLVGTIVASLAFAHATSRLPRRRFFALTFRSVACLWLAFVPAIARAEGELAVFVARSFYVVHAVTNVFLVSIVWALLADSFDSAGARRLFGLVSVGGTLGAIVGSSTTGAVSRWAKSDADPDAERTFALGLVLAAALVLEVAVWFGLALVRRGGAVNAASEQPERSLGGTWSEGLSLVLSRPYLQAVAAFTFLHGVLQSVLALQQNFLAAREFDGSAARAEYFAWTESAVQGTTLFVQLFITSRVMHRFGVGAALLALPAFGVLALSVLGVHAALGLGALGLLTIALVLWKALSHSLMRPARESLFAGLEPRETYKAKSFLDTFAFRGGDVASAWLQGTAALGVVALVALPLACAWGALATWLGRRASGPSNGALSDR